MWIQATMNLDALDLLMSGSYYYSEVEYTSPSFVQNIKKKLPITNDEFFTAKNSLVLNSKNRIVNKQIGSIKNNEISCISNEKLINNEERKICLFRISAIAQKVKMKIR